MAFPVLWTPKGVHLIFSGEGTRNNMKNVLTNSDKYLIETVTTNNYIFFVTRHK